MSFREDIFVRALTERPEDARHMSQVFDPGWLASAPLQPILAEVYEFTRTKKMPPSIPTLREIFRDKDKEMYENRFQRVFDTLEKLDYDASQALYALDKAKGVAVTRSLVQLIGSPGFEALKEDNDGPGQMREIHEWIRQFEADAEAVELDLKQGVEQLVQSRAWTSGDDLRIPTGIKVIDEWSGGGLRKKQLAILMAPSGHGKSVVLFSLAHNVAKQLDRNVLLISNELTTEEMTERLLSKITGESISRIMHDPLSGHGKLERHWKMGLHSHLRLVEVNKEIDANYIESLVAKYRTLYSWIPDVVVIDYMERMKPSVAGVRRDQSWSWLGNIAKDLVWMAKRGNYLVWTACQTNRSGYNSQADQDFTQAQGSIQHFQEATMVVAMRKVKYKSATQEAETDVLQFKPLKVRQDKGGHDPVYVEAKLGYMNITDNRLDAAEITLADAPMKKKGKKDESEE